MEDLTKKLTGLVEKKVGRVIEDELKGKITFENLHFDVSGYANELFEKYFTGSDIEREIATEIAGSRRRVRHYESSDESTETDVYSRESFEFDPVEFNNLTVDEIVNNLQSDSEETRLKYLRELEISAEDLINSGTSWNVVKKILRNFLEGENGRDLRIFTLKIFQRFLFSSNKPQMVCDAFVCLTEIVSNYIEWINSAGNESNSFEEVYDLKEKKWLGRITSSECKVFKDESNDEKENGGNLDSEILIKSMFLLVKCQNQMPGKWLRFNDKRLREIIFSFVHLLSSTTNSDENDCISGFELLSILNPTGNWCRRWCHSATGRTLICSALRKYKQFFVRIVDIILIKMKERKFDRFRFFSDDSISPGRKMTSIEENGDAEDRIKSVRSAPIRQVKMCSDVKSGKIFGKSIRTKSIEGISKNLISQATFCHSLSLLVILIQFRSGRSLFPVQTNWRKRLLSVHDLISTLTDYIQNFDRDRNESEEVKLTRHYKEHLLEMEKILNNVRTAIHSCRKSADRMKFNQR